MQRGYWQQLRIRVTNGGSQGVQRVRAVLRPSDGSYYYFLHMQHDNEYEVSRTGEYLTTGQRMYFDVALVKRENAGAFFWSYADIAISENLRQILTTHLPDGGSWEVEIDVSGWTDFRDVVGTTKRYKITLDTAHQLSMEEVLPTDVAAR